MKCTFDIDRKPVPKKRARADTSGNSTTFYTPSETKKFEEIIGWAGKRCRPNGWPLRAYYQLRFAAYFPNHRIPDLDNVCKSVQDGLEGVLWFNDIRVRKTEHEALTVPTMRDDGFLRVQAETIDKLKLERQKIPYAR
jgi:Holliday junction resolvase RusA-like endonuclease